MSRSVRSGRASTETTNERPRNRHAIRKKIARPGARAAASTQSLAAGVAPVSLLHDDLRVRHSFMKYMLLMACTAAYWEGLATLTEDDLRAQKAFLRDLEEHLGSRRRRSSRALRCRCRCRTRHCPDRSPRPDPSSRWRRCSTRPRKRFRSGSGHRTRFRSRFPSSPGRAAQAERRR